MKPKKEGQIVKFHTPYANEDSHRQFVILEIHFDVDKPRAKIMELNSGKPLASIMIVLVEELEVVKITNNDLIGHKVKINKADYSIAIGKVLKVNKQQNTLELNKTIKGVQTNVWLTIQDDNGIKHKGTLFIN